MMGPIFAAPLWYLGDWFGDPIVTCSYYNLLLLLIATTAMWLVLEHSVPRSVSRRFLLLLLLGSMFPFHQRTFYGYEFSALAVMLGLALVFVRRQAWGWGLMVMAVVNTPAAAVALCLVVLVKSARDRRVAPLLVLVLTAALILGENWLKRGSPFSSGYEGAYTETNPIMPFSGRGGFGYPLFFGVIGVLFSFGKGIFWYAPGLLVSTGAVKKAPPFVREFQLYSLLFLAGLVLLYAKWANWSGDQFWGPRFLLYASVPASFALAYRLEEPGGPVANATTLLILILSMWVGLNGAVFGVDSLFHIYRNYSQLGYLTVHVPEYSALFRPFVVRRAMDPGELIAAAYYLVVSVYLGGRTAITLAAQVREGVTRLLAHLTALTSWRI